MLNRYLNAQRDEGFSFEHMKPMSLEVHDNYGDPVPGYPGLHLVQRFTFEGGELTGVFVSRPGGDITFVMVAEDGVQSAGSSANFLASLPE